MRNTNRFAIIWSIRCLLSLRCFQSLQSLQSQNTVKNRIIVLTDIENEPDDAMSMVRFLTYCNQWDVEGIVATSSVHQKNRIAELRIREIVAAYGKVQPNLLKH